jgi:quinoprotein glucose dehydrogenase
MIKTGLRLSNLKKLLVLVAAVGALGLGARANMDRDWREYSGDDASTKYSPLTQIDRNNVRKLRIAWRRPHIDPAAALVIPKDYRLPNNFEATPIMVKGVMYMSDAIGLAEAFDPETGKTIWVQKAGEEDFRGETASRAVAYWNEGTDERVFAHRGHFLYALNAKTGAPIQEFGTRGAVDLNVGMDLSRGGDFRSTSGPIVAEDVVLMGQSMGEQDSARRKEGQRGEVRAYDVHNGKLRWTFSVIPREGEAGLETWKNDSWRYTGAGNVWSLMSVDDKLGYVYLPTTSPTNDMYGGHRLGNNLFTDSVVCLEAKTGRQIWHFQVLHHDLFDYDLPAAPILVDITVDGRNIRALAQVSKQGFVYVLDRVTGKPVWPIEERPVPQSDVPGEESSATQPFPTKPPPFEQRGVTEDDLIDFTPELHAEALALLKKFRHGPVFTPPSVVSHDPNGTQGTLQMPGSVGGANWTGAAFDPETKMLYVPSLTNPFVANLIEGKPEETNLRYRAGDRHLIQLEEGVPLTKPPYGRITAYSLNRGDIAWVIPNGDGPRHHPRLEALNLPRLGQPCRASVLVTKTLLFVTEGDQIASRMPPGGGGNEIRAYDKKTGDVVWEYAMDAGSTGSLMTYMYKGKQYIVIAIGGATHPAEFLAFALPS